jgi:hypothetical protein
MIGTRQQQWIVGASATAGVLLIAAIVLAHRHGTPAKDQHTLDSLQITKPIFQATQDSLAKRETTYAQHVDSLQTIITQLKTTSSVQHRRADSLAAIAARSSSSPAQRAEEFVLDDSAASRWHAAYDARTQEAATLRVSLDSSTAQFNAEHQARLAADTRANNAMLRLVPSEDLNTRLAADVKKASECKILFITCPSRTVMFIAGAVTVEAAHMVATRHFP